MNIEHNKAVHISTVLNKLKFTVERGALSIKDIGRIEITYLTDYLQSYYIPLPVAKKYLAQLRIYNKKTRNHFYALGFKNSAGGYEFCNKMLKGYIDERAVTFINGKEPEAPAIHIFGDCADFLSLSAGQPGGRLRHNSLVLNSPHLWRTSLMDIYNPRYKVAFTWLNNGPDGKLIRDHLDEYFKSQKIIHTPMNETYNSSLSLTAWRIHEKSKVQKLPE